jgi:FkbM family methyltransferase
MLHTLRTEARLQPGFETGYVRFVRSLRERLHPRGVRDIRTVTLPGGPSFQVNLGDRLGCDVYYGYVEEQFEASLFAEMLPHGGTMVDVGANFGYYAVRCAEAVGPTGAVHAFEPDPTAHDLLSANAVANGLAGILQPHRAAVADHDGEVQFYVAEEAAFSSMTATGRSATRDVLNVPARTLDSFAAEQGITRIDALKIDVEGHEAAVLQGAAGILAQSPDPLVMLEVSAKNLSDTARVALVAALDALYRAGFGGLIPDLSAEGGLRAVDSVAAATALTSANLFLVRPGGRTIERLRAVAARRIANPDALDAPPPIENEATGARLPMIRLFAGLDPDLVGAALRDKADTEERAAKLSHTFLRQGEQIALLRADRDALRAEVRKLRGMPFGLAFRIVRRVGRSLMPTRKRRRE